MQRGPLTSGNDGNNMGSRGGGGGWTRGWRTRGRKSPSVEKGEGDVSYREADAETGNAPTLSAIHQPLSRLLALSSGSAACHVDTAKLNGLLLGPVSPSARF